MVWEIRLDNDLTLVRDDRVPDEVCIQGEYCPVAIKRGVLFKLVSSLARVFDDRRPLDWQPLEK